MKTRTMTAKDINPAIGLTETMKWGFTEDDFKFMMELEPEGCLVTLDDEQLVGLTTTVSFEDHGWIGNVIVDADYRKKGIGSTLIHNAMNYLKGRGVTTIGLYAYLNVVTFYEQFGFKKDETFTYLTCPEVKVKGSRAKTVKQMRNEDFENILKLDRRCTGVSREKLLRAIFARSRELCYTAHKGDEPIGYVMARGSPEAAEIGPLVCENGSEDTAINLLNAQLGKLIGAEAYIGVPENKPKTLSTLRELGFRENFKVIRMYYGSKPQARGCAFAMESLERG